MQQGYIPPKRQNDNMRNRRAQKHTAVANPYSAQPEKKTRRTLIFRILIGIVIVAILYGYISAVIHNTDDMDRKISQHSANQSTTGNQETIVPATMQATSAPTPTAAPTATPAPTRKPYNTLSQGSQGNDVKEMQSRLIQLGYLNDAADGAFGKKTLNALKTFQAQNDLGVTGIADDETLVRLYSNYAIEYSPPQYSAGMYKVGYDIEPGEYIVLATSSNSAYLCLSSDSNGDDIIANDIFDYNSIITVKTGEYLEISRAKMMLLSDFVKSYTIPKNENGTMFKVGTNLKAGEYKLVTTSSYGGYYCIYDSSRQDHIVTNNNFENRIYVTVKNGQYLALSRCSIAN